MIGCPACSLFSDSPNVTVFVREQEGRFRDSVSFRVLMKGVGLFGVKERPWISETSKYRRIRGQEPNFTGTLPGNLVGTLTSVPKGVLEGAAEEFSKEP